MKNSISQRIALITFALISIVFLLTFLFQTLFFQEFYLNKKTQSLLVNVKRLQTMYAYQVHNNNNSLIDALKSYEETNNSRIAIFSLDGKLKYLTDYDGNFEDMQLLTNFCSELLADKDLINEVISTGKMQSTLFTTNDSDIKKIGIIAPMSLQSENDSIIISVSSIQPIKEASTVIQSFYFYLLIGFLILAIFLSRIYSQLISNPLIKLNNVAKKMSLLDFKAKCDVSSNDEIGNLASTLNFLSSNLEKSLQDLREKNEQLEEDIEKERNLEKMRKDFVATVSHDLKTPIGIISGYAEGLKDGIVSGENAKIYLETIIDEAGKMNSLLTNMLQLSKLESGDIILNLEEFNIIRMIQSIVKKFSLEFKNKDLKVIFLDLPEYAYVKADILQMEQVIKNLISNCIKYTPSNNNIFISIIEGETNYIVSIENKGVTLPEEEIDNLFAKFYKLDKSGDRSQNSFGLGLASVKRILELHNSTFSIKNTLDGVIFTFTLSKVVE